MHLRRHLPVGLKPIIHVFAPLIVILTVSGCLMPRPASQSKLPPPTKSPTEIAPATTRPDQMDASTVDPAQLVAERAQRYSQEMAPALARRADASPPPAQAAPAQPSSAQSAAVQPSLVQWGDPSSSQLSLLPGYLLRPDSPPPALAAVDASASAANASAGQLASMKTPGGANSATFVSPRQPNGDPATDRARTQFASIAPAAVPSESIQASPSDAQSVTADTSNGAAGSGASADTLSALSAKLSKRVHDYPHDVSAQFDDQLLQFLMDEPVPNLSTISSLPDEDREMVAAVMDGLSNYRNNLRADNNMLLSHKVRPLLEMADRLRSLADLTIPTLALCQEVRGFGVYTPFDGDPPHFAAGTEHPVILYCEVQNFSSQLNDDKAWQTELVQDTVLYTEGGMSVWNDKTRTVNDTARNRRQDFFLVQRINLPAALPMGRYLLKVTIEDKQSHHVAEATQPLLIIAQ